MGARADGDFDPGEQVRFAAAGIFCRGIFNVAILLLPHLVKAMYRAGGVVIV